MKRLNGAREIVWRSTESEEMEIVCTLALAEVETWRPARSEHNLLERVHECWSKIMERDIYAIGLEHLKFETGTRTEWGGAEQVSDGGGLEQE
eukprot:2361414-Heterocapsa_arctica.AAC.1